MSWANFVTMVRILLIPVFVVLMFVAGPSLPEEPAVHAASYFAFIVFSVAAMSDSLDGYLARRFNRVTRLGQFLDPLADKLLIGAALVTLVMLRGFPAWAAIVIVTREVAVSVLRSMALRRGRDLPASRTGKIKTALQIPTVMLWLLPRAGWISIAQDLSVIVAVILTLLSGIQYFMRTRELLRPRDDVTAI
ncbi:MAG: CDP-diacylglycerol--glycerol-3-phosphate 3-phosphatidyltransferase [Actinobacteria bacterium]|nr:CDP-diacylglycerol--glycerol-3-phosphate 3-phosphatidyltransferase [Actinomycetota bacterium]